MQKDSGGINTPLTPEVAHLMALLQQLSGNNLSSVEINRNAKGGKTTHVKVYHENPFMAQNIAEKIDNEIRSKS